ncbi:MAG: MarC family protein [Phycisphaerae bacterium]
MLADSAGFWMRLVEFVQSEGLWKSLFTDFVTLFVVVDPIGTVPLFLAIAGARPPAELNRIANRAVLIAACVLIAFLFAGQFVLEAMGIGIHAFRIAGGIVLFYLAFTMIFAEPKAQKRDVQEVEGDPAIFPLGMPAIAGPGTILTVVVLTDYHRFSFVDQARTGVVLLLVLFVQWAFLRAAIPLQRLMGMGGANILSRVMGLILAALAVETILAGLRAAGFALPTTMPG